MIHNKSFDMRAVSFFFVYFAVPKNPVNPDTNTENTKEYFSPKKLLAEVIRHAAVIYKTSILKTKEQAGAIHDIVPVCFFVNI